MTDVNLGDAVELDPLFSPTVYQMRSSVYFVVLPLVQYGGVFVSFRCPSSFILGFKVIHLPQVVKVGRDGGGNAGTPVLSSRLRTRSGKLLDVSNQVRRMDSKLLRSFPSEGLSAVGAENVSRPSPMGSCSRSDGCGSGGERRGLCSDACCPVQSSSAGVRREQLGAPLGSSGKGEGLENGRVRRKRSVGRSSFSCPRLSLGEVNSPCRAKLHGIFKHAQRQSRDGRFLLLLGGSDQPNCSAVFIRDCHPE